ncbi:hypothetical protein F5Y07DRAFT_61197 [Xylaria sp. FL0933]|nr:hypothetical protein F5Y07DRAFT_61197 [Xylaria sp. FL0933]
MSSRNEASAPSQTDCSNADNPGHTLPDASASSITVHHARQAAPSGGPDMQGNYDHDVCVCVTCRVRCPNDVALHKHGKAEAHPPFGCVCGATFSRPDTLERHILSKNKVPTDFCPLCKRGETPKAFSRADHLYQHLRNFHRIPTGRIPAEFSDTMPQFPCQIPGCPRTGELAYLRQLDLDEHMAYMHYSSQNGVSIQQGLSDSAPYTGHDFQQSVCPQTAPFSEQDAQNGFFWQRGEVDNVQADKPFLRRGIFVEDMGSQPHGDFDFPH